MAGQKDDCPFCHPEKHGFCIVQENDLALIIRRSGEEGSKVYIIPRFHFGDAFEMGLDSLSAMKGFQKQIETEFETEFETDSRVQAVQQKYEFNAGHWCIWMELEFFPGAALVPEAEFDW